MDDYIYPDEGLLDQLYVYAFPFKREKKRLRFNFPLWPIYVPLQNKKEKEINNVTCYISWLYDIHPLRLNEKSKYFDTKLRS